jgi:hypothetical protein
VIRSRPARRVPLRHPVYLLLVFGLLSCDDPSGPGRGGGGEAVHVTTVVPADGASDIPLTAVFSATFDADVAPSTLGPATATLELEGSVVPTTLAYDADTRTVRLIAPLLPGKSYRARLDPAIRGLDGGSLAEGREWSATTRPWAATVLSSLGQLSFPTLEVGPSGRVHLAGRRFEDGAARVVYAECSATCSDPASWGRVVPDGDYELAGGVALQAEASGTVHLLHVSYSPVAEPESAAVVIRYGSCASNCLNSASWTFGTVDSFPGFGHEGLLGFAWHEANREIHLVTYAAFGDSPLRHRACGFNCTDPVHWGSEPIPVTGYPTDGNGLRVDATGRLHVLTSFANVLSYSTCGGACGLPEEWTTTPLESASSVSFTTDPASRVHLLLTDQSRAFTYVRCDGNCGSALSWSKVRLDQGDVYGSAIAVDKDGRITALEPVALDGSLRYLTCATGCLDPSNWQSAAVDRSAHFDLPYWGPPRLAPGPEGRVHAIFLDGQMMPHYVD